MVTDDGVSYENAAPIEFDTADFSGRLEADVLVLSLKRHAADQVEARALVDPFIRAWEIDAGLTIGRPEFTLRFDSAQVVDRAPTPGIHELQANATAIATATLQLKVFRGHYPVPLLAFRTTPEVEALWARYLRYLAGSEPLLSMAYACLTLLERGNRRQAAGLFGVEYEVLSKLGDLTSTRGDALTARKPGQATAPLSSTEAQWVDAAIRAVIRHLATRAGDKRLKMADLPAL